MYQQTITVTYYNGSTTASKAAGTRYYNAGSGAKINPSFTLSQTSLSGWAARGWSTGSAGNGSISYNNAAAFTRDSNITLYGMYQQTITLTLYNGSTSASKYTGTRYFNSGSGNVVNPAFSVNAASLNGYSFNGWASSSSATAGISYSAISGTTFSSHTTLYGRYSQTITLSYNANGGSGTTSAQTGTRYWNTGNASNPTFTLYSSGFTRSGYTFSKWALGGTGGTQYSAGSSITLSSNATMYAIWTSNSYYAIKDGVLVNAGSATAWCGGYSNKTGTHAATDNVPKAYYGGSGHTNSTNQSWGASTGNLDTKGCATLKVVYAYYSWSNAPTALITVTGISSSGAETTISSEYMFSDFSDTQTYAVSSYSRVRVRIDASANKNHNTWMNVGFHLVQFY